MRIVAAELNRQTRLLKHTQQPFKIIEHMQSIKNDLFSHQIAYLLPGTSVVIFCDQP